ncbi:MAG: Ig-like domain repeat protein [Terriglobales bacterium]|jgi:hypothetical protein
MRSSQWFSFVFSCLLAGLVSGLMLAQSSSSPAVHAKDRGAVIGSHSRRGTGITTVRGGEPGPRGSQAAGLNFAPAVVYAGGGSGFESVAMGDVNGDGKLDMIVANYCDEVSNCTCTPQTCDYGSVGVLLGNGDGTFQPAVTYLSGGYYSQAVAVADVNGDGKLDILVVNDCTSNINCAYTIGDGSVAVLLGNGDGTFQPAVAYDTGGQFPNQVLIADMNNDGKPDLIVSNFSGGTNGFGEVGILLGNGDGTFQPAVIYNSAYSYNLAQVAIADINGDGNLDLLVANECTDLTCASGDVGVLLGNGDGTFRPGVAWPSGGYYTHAIAVTDMNGDGKLDLVVANSCMASSNCSSNGTVAVILGNGDGSLQAPVTYPAGAYEPLALVLGDFNTDGKTDVALVSQSVTGSNTAGVVGVLLGNGDGTLQPALNFNPGGSGSIALAAADVNKDGKPDLMVVTSAGVGVLLNTSTKATTTKVASSNNPSSLGQAVTFKATVTPQGNGTPTGTVSFLDGSASIGNSPVSGGVATLTTSSLALGAHSITATYNGDSNWAASTSAALSQSVQGAVVGLSTTNLNFGNQTVGIASAAQNVVVTNQGNIALKITSIQITGTNKGDFSQTNGCGSPVAPSGTCTISVTFKPTASGPASAGIAIADNAGNSPQGVTLTGIGGHPVGMVTPSSLAFGDETEGTISSTPQKVSLSNTGDYQMTITSVTTSTNFNVWSNQCTAPVQPGASCDVYVVFAPVQLGALSGTLTFTDSAANNPQTAQLSGIGQSPTTTMLTATPKTAVLGQPVTLTATVVPEYSGTPSGTVTFYDGTSALGTVGVNLGTAQLVLPTLYGGSHSLTASYSGDAVFLTSVSAAVIRVVAQVIPTATVASNLNPSTVSQAVTFTATVAGIKSIVPTGTVIFKQGVDVLGTVAIVNGQASFTYTFTKAGTAAITASYSGDQNYKAVNAKLKQLVQ